MKKILVVIVAFFAACAINAKESSKNLSPIHNDLLVEVKSAAKEFAIQLDGGNEVMMTKFATDNTFSVTLPNVADGEHTLECINEETNKQVQCPSVTIKKFAKCTYSENKLLLKFSSPVTAADEGCEGIKYWQLTGNRRSVLLEALDPILTDEIVQKIIDEKVQTLTVDVECVIDPACDARLQRLDENNVIVRVYVNPFECPVSPVTDWMYGSRKLLEALCKPLNVPKYDGWKKFKADGTRLTTWDQVMDDGKEMKLGAMDLSSNCPRIDSKTWGEYFVDYWHGILKTRPHVRGMEMDNQKAYPSGILGYTIGDLSPFDVDLKVREGDRQMLEYASSEKKFGKNFVLTGRSNSFYFSDLLHGVTFESLFVADLGVKNNQTLQNFAVIDQTLRMSKAQPFITITHCKINCSSASGEDGETGFATAGLMTNAFYVCDEKGPNRHTWFEDAFCPKLFETGTAVGDLQFIDGAMNEIEGESLLTKDSEPLKIHVEAGQVVRFTYRIKGVYNSSTLAYTDEAGGNSFQQRWVDGTVYVQVQFTGDYYISFSGDGYVEVTDLVVVDMPSLICQEYTKGMFCRNPSSIDHHFFTFNGQTYEVMPGKGRAIAK